MASILKKILLLLLLIANQRFAQQDSLITSTRETYTFSVVGDIMAHQTQLNYARQKDGNYDFNPVFKEIKNIISEADYSFANLETACAGDTFEYKGYPIFNSPDTLVGALKYAGFDHLFTANNHLMDMGVYGAKRTMKIVEDHALHYSGSNLTSEREKRVKFYNVKDLKVAFLSYTYFSNHGNGGKNYILNKIDTTEMRKDYDSAGKKNPDLIIVYFHFGTEEQREPDKSQKENVKKAIELGADIIIGGHPHRLQPIEMFKTNHGRIDTGFVVYSMGNFVSNQRWRYNDAGAVLNFTLERDSVTSKLFLADLSFIPTWVYKGYTERGREFIILPSELAFAEDYPTFLKDEDLQLMKQSFNDCKEIFLKYSAFPRLKSIFN